jgi:DNA-binding response OmpR family regulator
VAALTSVLVVDDQADIRELLRTLLDLHGHHAELAAGGSEALQKLDSGYVPDLIVLDVQMPEKDGWDTLSEIRARYGEFGPRVVLCTVKGHPRDLLHGWMLGCDGYVWKPFDLKLLVEEVGRVLSRDDDNRAQTRRRAVGEARLLLRAAE